MYMARQCTVAAKISALMSERQVTLLLCLLACQVLANRLFSIALQTPSHVSHPTSSQLLRLSLACCTTEEQRYRCSTCPGSLKELLAARALASACYLSLAAQT